MSLNPLDEGRRDVYVAYGEWTAALANRSVSTCYAIIAAAWTLHGQCALERREVKWAVFLAVLYLGINLCVMLWMAHAHYARHRLSEERPKAWEEDFRKKLVDPARYRFPYTLAIDRLGLAYAWTKVLFPAAAAVFLLYSVFSYEPCRKDFQPAGVSAAAACCTSHP